MFCSASRIKTTRVVVFFLSQRVSKTPWRSNKRAYLHPLTESAFRACARANRLESPRFAFSVARFRSPTRLRRLVSPVVVRFAHSRSRGNVVALALSRPEPIGSRNASRRLAQERRLSAARKRNGAGQLRALARVRKNRARRSAPPILNLTSPQTRRGSCPSLSHHASPVKQPFFHPGKSPRLY